MDQVFGTISLHADVVIILGSNCFIIKAQLVMGEFLFGCSMYIQPERQLRKEVILHAKVRHLFETLESTFEELKCQKNTCINAHIALSIAPPPQKKKTKYRWLKNYTFSYLLGLQNSNQTQSWIYVQKSFKVFGIAPQGCWFPLQLANIIAHLENARSGHLSLDFRPRMWLDRDWFFDLNVIVHPQWLVPLSWRYHKMSISVHT